jgi:GTP-binding protein EngB required for normal cell division
MARSSIPAVLEKTLEFLQEDGALLMAAEARECLVQRLQSLLDKARSPGEVLYVGILGGTGVGKSTLINALAQENISQPSDRRPFTDLAVVYRHKDALRGLEEISDFVRNPDALHDSEPVKDLVLLDLPDFDSVVEDNRNTVLKILPFVDAVVWVVSPEKYADSAFYQFLGKIAIHRENFTFVLNKADEVVGPDQSDPHAKLKEMLGDLTFRLKHEGGVEQPRIFSFSAAQEFRRENEVPVLANEFRRFREFLMIRRDAKEIASIKTANLVEEIRQIMAEINSAVKPEDKAAALTSLKSVSMDEPSEEQCSNLRLIEQEKRLEETLYALLMGSDRSISPVKWGMRLAGLRRTFLSTGTDNQLEEVFRSTSEIIGKSKRRDLEEITARIDSEILLAFTPTGGHQLEGRPEHAIANAISRASVAFAERVESARNALAGSRSKWTRLFQKLLLLLPVPLLALRLAGPDAIGSWLDQPSVRGALKIALYLLTSLFSADGLTGLAALLVCEFFLVWYLASRRVKSIGKVSNKLTQYAIELVGGTLDSVVRQIKSQRRALLERIEHSIHRLEALNQSCDGALRVAAPSDGELHGNSASWKS